MFPAGITLTTLLTDAASVVDEFATLLAILIALVLGFYVVKSIPSWVKRAR